MIIGHFDATSALIYHVQWIYESVANQLLSREKIEGSKCLGQFFLLQGASLDVQSYDIVTSSSIQSA